MSDKTQSDERRLHQEANEAGKPSWQEAAREMARNAALREDRIRMGWESTEERMPPFAYRWEHVQQVVRYGHWLLSQVEADTDIVIAACWLHDVKKLEPNHAQRGAAFARTFLPKTDFPAHKIESVALAIEQHKGLLRRAETEWNGSQAFRPAPPLEPIESALMWDADKLSKIGPIALLHSYSANLLSLQKAGKSITTEQIIQQNQQWLKIVVPKIIASFNTLVAQHKAIQLHAAYERFLQSAEQTLALLLPSSSHNEVAYIGGVPISRTIKETIGDVVQRGA